MSAMVIRNVTLGLFFLFFLCALGFVYAVQRVNSLMTQQVMALSDEDFRRQYTVRPQEEAGRSLTGFTQKILGRKTAWKTYINPYLHVSFEYPDMAILSSPDCPAVLSPVQPFTDNGQRTIFLALAHRFGETCSTQATTLQELTMNAAITSSSVPWIIEIASTPEDTDLTSFIQRKFGPACSVGEMTETDYEGTLTVSIEGDGLPADKSACHLSARPVLKYHPSTRTAAAWTMSPEQTFIRHEGDSDGFDEDIAASFRWENDTTD